MTFREYYLELKEKERPPHPARAFILSIAEKTGRSPKTVQQWACGIQTPGRDVAILISQEIGIPLHKLFPDFEDIQKEIFDGD